MLASRYADPAPEDASKITPKRKPSTEEKPLPPVPAPPAGLGASRYADDSGDDTQKNAYTPSKRKSSERNQIASGSGGKTPVLRSPDAKNREGRRTGSVQLDHAKSQSTELQTALGISSPKAADVQPQSNGISPAINENVPAVVADTSKLQALNVPPVKEDNTPQPKPIEPQAVPSAIPARVRSSTPDIVRTGSPAGGRIVRRSKRGKAVTIRVPPAEAHVREGWRPLSEQEVRDRLDALEKDGYDTRGFGYWRSEGVSLSEIGNGQVVPNEVAGIVKETTDEKPMVTIPDMNKWDDYVNDLTEQKLRALGVSMFDDEPTQPPSRNESAQYPPLAMSPPVPSSSTVSQQMFQHTLPFSAPFSPGTSTNDTSLGAIASPALSLNQQLRPGHLSRQSTFGIPNVPTPSSSYTQHGNAPMWSPQPPMGNQQHQQFSAAAQPFHFPSATPDFFSDRQQTPRAFEVPQPQVLPSRSPAPSPFNDAQDAIPSKAQEERPATPPQTRNDQYAELAYPTPRGHRHNISAQLEKEAENPQYYPGEYVDQRLDAEHEVQANAKTSAPTDSSRMPFSFGQPRASGHQPSASMASNASASKLNVQAKEFKFNPQSAHGKTFSIPKAALMPDVSKPSILPTVSYITAHGNGVSSGDADFNVKAKAFQPQTAAAFAFAPNVETSFNFAAEKEKAANASKEATPEPPPSGHRIFGGFSMADIIKPAKKSKAIPIVNPNAVKHEDDGEPPEDDDGRVAQGTSRIKRGRTQAPSGDDIPLFAEPTPEPPVLKSNAPVFVPSQNVLPSQPETLTEKVDVAEAQDNDDSMHLSSNGSTKVQDAETTFGIAETARDDPKAIADAAKEDPSGVNEDTVDEEGSDVAWHDFGIESLREQSRRRDVQTSDVIRSISPPMHRATKPSSRSSRGEDSPRPQLEGTPNMNESDDGKSSSAETEELRKQERFQQATPEPSMRELNAIMDHINRNDLEDTERDEPSTREQKRYVPPHMREDKDEASSATDGLLKAIREPTPPPVLRNVSPPSDLLSGDMHDIQNPALQAHLSLRPSRGESKRTSRSPVRRLNNLREPPISDWDEAFSPTEDFKLLPRPQQSDIQMKMLFENLLKTHLEPLQKTIKELHEKQAAGRDMMVSGAGSSHDQDKSSSDADDEDDASDASPNRKRTMRADAKNEKLRVAVIDAIKSTQSHGLSQAVEQMRLRNEAETRSAELQRLLTISEKEIDLYKESTENLETRIKDLEGDRRDLLRQVTEAEKIESDLKRNASDVEIELAKRENLINEYRSSSTKWQDAFDNAKKTSEELVQKIDQIKRDAADKQLTRETLESKLINLEKAVSESEQTLSRERLAFQQAREEASRRLSEAEEMFSKERIGYQEAKSEAARKFAEVEEILNKERSGFEETRDTTSRTFKLAEEALKKEHAELSRQLTLAEETLAKERVEFQEAKTELSRKLVEVEETLAKERVEFSDAKNEANHKHVQNLEMIEETLKHERATAQVATDEMVRKHEQLLAEAESTLRNERVTWQAANEEANRKLADSHTDADEIIKKERALWHQEREELNRKHNESLVQAQQSLETGLGRKLASAERAVVEAEKQLKSERATWQTNNDEQARKHSKAITELEDALHRERNNSQQWEEEQSRKLETIKVRLDESVRQRGLAEKEIQRLAVQERELIKKNVMLEEVTNSNSRLQNEIEQVRSEAIRHQRAATHHQHEAAETRRDIESEVRRAKHSLEAEIEIANRKVESMRAELETRMNFMRTELDSARENGSATKKRLEKELQHAQTSRQEALQTISQASNASLKEERQKFERALKDMSSQHDRSIKFAIEDKERVESLLREKLDASQLKSELLDEKIKHLEDKVAVAQAAAKSAAESARSAAARAPAAAVASSGLPERISPQALRESIAVLQEQLQERETRIESLESQLSESSGVETKLRERDHEISWLRELLNVRVDDLSDLVNTMSQEDFDRDAAVNAAIRIQANLQMERQEKALPGRNTPGRSTPGRQPPPSLPSLQDLQNFASPRAAQLSAAWSSWRKGKPGASMSGLREAMNSTPSRAAPSSVIAEGSNSAQSFLSGLMTPPASNLRHSPSFEKPPPPLTLAPEAAAVSPPRRGNRSSRHSSYALPVVRDHTPDARSGSRESLPPTTPPLMRKGSYDQDAMMAEPAVEDDDNDVDDVIAQGEPGPSEIQNEEPVQTIEATQLEPLGQVIASE